MEWKVAFPLHPEYRTLPMVWYIPPLSPIQNAAEAGKIGSDGAMPNVHDLRIPVRYLANMLTAGDEAPVVAALERMLAMRAYMRGERVAGRFTPAEPKSVLAVEQLAQIGQRMNIRVDRFPVPIDPQGHPDPDALPALVTSAAATGPQFLYLGPDSFIGQYARRVTDLANEHRLPSFASVERMLSGSDALYGLVAPYRKVGRFTATKVERILFGGDDPADVPVEVLPEFSYFIRADVARDLEIFPRLSLLEYAETIEP